MSSVRSEHCNRLFQVKKKSKSMNQYILNFVTQECFPKVHYKGGWALLDLTHTLHISKHTQHTCLQAMRHILCVVINVFNKKSSRLHTVKNQVSFKNHQSSDC